MAALDPQQSQTSLPPNPPTTPDPAPFKWPNRREDYDILEVIGSGATAVVQTARCRTNDQVVAIKRIDLERCGTSIEELQKEIALMSNCNHPNVINYHTSFVVKDELWLVMKLMAGGSLLDIVKHVMTKGNKGGVLDEVVIATVLREVLLGLEYFHGNGQIHRDVKAGNILVGEDGTVQLADFGVSSWLYDSQQRVGGKGASKKKPRKTFVGTPCWMAPEVMDQSVGYNEKADIWSFGITALELATGTAPYAKFPPMKVLMLTLENPPPTLETCGDLNGEDYRKNYSKSFQKMVEKCMQRDPEKRPSAAELLKFPFFKKARNKEYIKDVVVGDAPSLASRGKKVRRVPGTSGRLYKTEDGGWVWSDDELMEEYEGEKEAKEKKSTKEGIPEGTPSQLQPAKSEVTPPPVTMASSGTPTPSRSASSQPVQTQSLASGSASSLPSIQVQPPLQDLAALQQQRQSFLQQLKATEQQLATARQQQQQLILLQQQNPAQFTQEHQMQVLRLLETTQALERQMQQFTFQLQQIDLSLEQAQKAQEFHKQFQDMLEIQKSREQIQPEGGPRPKIKLALRKRTEQNQLKDIKFDFQPGQDSADAIAKDLIAAGLVDGRNLVVVAANIQKIVENPLLEKVVFQLASPNVTPDQLDDKKLLGYAQLTVISKK